MADAGDLLYQLRAHLVAVGLARLPSTPASGLPPLWIQPEGGAPAPGDKAAPEDNADLVVSAVLSGGIAPPSAYESFWRRDTVELWLRARKAPYATDFEAVARAELVGDIGKREWSLAALNVHESREWRPLQPFSVQGPGHTFSVAYVFEYDA